MMESVESEGEVVESEGEVVESESEVESEGEVVESEGEVVESKSSNGWTPFGSGVLVRYLRIASGLGRNS